MASALIFADGTSSPVRARLAELFPQPDSPTRASTSPLAMLKDIPETMEYYSAIKKNSFESVLMRWMKLEPIIQSEVSQKEKHQYSILTHIYGI